MNYSTYIYFITCRTYEDPSSKRFIMNFNVGHPFVRGDVEFVTLTVEGQSFMIHQIRKMIGLVIYECMIEKLVYIHVELE